MGSAPVQRRVSIGQKMGTIAARNQTVADNLGLAVYSSRRWLWAATPTAGFGLERSDLTQIAALGIIRAVDRFDPAIGKLSTYACRGADFALRTRMRCSGNAPRVEFRQVGGDDYDRIAAAPDAGGPSVSPEAAEFWRMAMKLLNRQQRKVIAGRYRGKSLAEIALKLGVTKQRISQIELRAMDLLRRKFAPTNGV